jgi:hypothetical protein
VTEALVVIIDGDGKYFFGAFLADDILVQYRVDFPGNREVVSAGVVAVFLDFLANNVIAKVHAFITDEHGRPGYELADLMLAFAAERAVKQLAAVTGIGGFFAHSAALRPIDVRLITVHPTMKSFAAICKPSRGAKAG